MPINYKNYPSNWFSEIRPRILDRDEHCCHFCGVPNYTIIYRPFKGKPDWKITPEGFAADVLAIDGFSSVRIVLTIAHLDHDHNNSADDNLAALCQRCHLLHDAQQHAANRKYGRNWKKYQLSLEFGL